MSNAPRVGTVVFAGVAVLAVLILTLVAPVLGRSGSLYWISAAMGSVLAVLAGGVCGALLGGPVARGGRLRAALLGLAGGLAVCALVATTLFATLQWEAFAWILGREPPAPDPNSDALPDLIAVYWLFFYLGFPASLPFGIGAGLLTRSLARRRAGDSLPPAGAAAAPDR